MSKDHIQQSLNSLQQKRESLKRQLEASQEVLLSVDSKIAEFERRQEERLTSDQRIDNETVRKVTDKGVNET